MKLILIPLLLLLASCSQYMYDISYIKCNGEIGTISGRYYQYDSTVRWLFVERNTITNICDFSYTRNEIK